MEIERGGAAGFGDPLPEGTVVDKGLKRDALGLATSTAVGIASTAPAYSLAATLGFVVAVVGLQTPLLVVLAFIPMFFSAWATKRMNQADPDCGTSFTSSSSICVTAESRSRRGSR